MKNSEIKDLNVNDLKETISSEQESLRKLKFAHAISYIENPMKIRHTRKLIARLKTELQVKSKKA